MEMVIVIVIVIVTVIVIVIVIVIVTIHFFFHNEGEGDQSVACASQKERLTKATHHSMEEIMTKALPDKVIALLEKRSKGHIATQTF